jgi:hypothetical protein
MLPALEQVVSSEHHHQVYKEKEKIHTQSESCNQYNYVLTLYKPILEYDIGHIF